MRSRAWAALVSLGLGAAAALAGCGAVGAAAGGGAPRAVAKSQSGLPKGFLGGVIEGYYGTPWSVADTIATIQFIGEHHMNAYVYAPKDDPYQRSKWNILYPKQAFAGLRLLVQAAQRSHVQFVYSVSPGLTITYSSAKDRAALLAKVKQVHSLGVHVFMLSLDDIYRGLASADKKRYGNDMAYAQSDVANYLLTQMRKQDPQFRLLLTPTKYRGTDDIAYWDSLRRHLDKRVDVIWTGPGTLSDQITAADARKVSQYIGHKLVIWDNYPVNDYTYVIDHHPRLYMGPVIGRDPNLLGVVDGYLFNPMLQARASWVPLWTGADYLNDPHHYNPQASWQAAVRALGGPAWQTFQLFAADSSSYYRENQPPAQLVKDVQAFWKLSAKANLESSAAYRDFQAMSQADSVLSRQLPDRRLYLEIRPWTQLLSEQGRAGMLAVQALELARSGRSPDAKLAELASVMRTIQANPNAIADDVVADFVSRVQAATGSGGTGNGAAGSGG